jgi:predicted dehydrogenase
VLGIVDPSIDRVQHVLSQKRTSNAAVCYASAKHFLNIREAQSSFQKEGVEPQLIFLCSPPHFRGTITPGRDLETQLISAFGSSPIIFCEKPVSTARPHEPLKAAERLQSSGNIVSVGYMLRYLKAVQKAKQVIQQNNITVMSIGARYTCAYQKIRKFDWWDKSKLCGPIVEQATHFCDLCRYLGGEVDLDSVQAIALEHNEEAGKLGHQAIDESPIPEEQRIPRATTSFWYAKLQFPGTITPKMKN